MGQKRIPWTERAVAIRQEFPLSTELNWHKIFTEDPAILGIIINDILKLDQSRSGKPGKRPSLEEDSTSDRLKKIQNIDHTEKSFPEALKDLCDGRSIRAISAKTGLDKSYVHRLLSGNAVPSAETMISIAESFDKDPSYFLEYRINCILSILENRLIAAPESSVVFYNKVTGRKK